MFKLAEKMISKFLSQSRNASAYSQFPICTDKISVRVLSLLLPAKVGHLLELHPLSSNCEANYNDTVR